MTFKVFGVIRLVKILWGVSLTLHFQNTYWIKVNNYTPANNCMIMWKNAINTYITRVKGIARGNKSFFVITESPQFEKMHSAEAFRKTILFKPSCWNCGYPKRS